MDSQRRSLQNYLGFFAWILGLCSLLPFDMLAGEPIWPWMGLRDASFLDGLAICLPLIGTALFAVLARCHMTKLSLSTTVLGAIGLGWAVVWWAGQIPHPLPVFEHLTDGLPGLFSRSLWLLLLGISVSGAGVILLAGAVARADEPRFAIGYARAGRWMLLSGVCLVVLFYFVDYRGHIPLINLVAGMVQLLAVLHDVQGLALFSGHVLSIGPLLLALISAIRLFQKPRGRQILFYYFFIGFIPALCLLVGVRDLSINPVAALVHLRSSGLLLTVTLGVSLSLAAMCTAWCLDTPWSRGSMTALDQLFARAYSSNDPVGYFEDLFETMNPMVRLYARRRLRSWIEAARSGEQDEQSDLQAALRLMVQIQREEFAVTSTPRLPDAEDAEDVGAMGSQGLSWWLRGQWLSIAVLGLAGFLVFVSVYSRWRPFVPVCQSKPSYFEDDGNAEEVFSSLIPAVVLDMEKYGKLRHAAPLVDLERALVRLEPEAPGISKMTFSLLSTAAHGRYMFHSLRRVRDGLNSLLLRDGIPYYLSSRIVPRRDSSDLFYLLSYRIESCSKYSESSSGQDFSVLYLRRVDGLNIMESYMGVAEEEEEFVTVIMDRLSSFMQQQVFQLMTSKDLVGQIVASSVQELGGGVDDLKKGVDGELGKKILEGLTRHELHHRWMGLEPEPPAQLWAFLMDYSNNFVRAVTAEVGAFLGEMAYSPSYARLRLALMIDALGRDAGRKGIYGRARVFLIHEVLGVDSFLQTRPTLTWLNMAAERLKSMDDLDLSKSIDAAHRELFGVRVPRFELVDSFYSEGGGH